MEAGIRMNVINDKNIKYVKLSSSTKYRMDDEGLHLKCFRTNKELTIVGYKYNLVLLLNSLLDTSPIDTILAIIKQIDIKYYKELEDGGFLE